jgi:hypothetical protein
MAGFPDYMKRAHATRAAETPQDVLDAKARMRRILDDAKAADRKAAQLQHRTNSGQYRKHETMNSHDVLAAHLTGSDHRAAMLPEWRSSTRNMQAAHLAMHAAGVDHDLEEGMSE